MNHYEAKRLVRKTFYEKIAAQLEAEAERLAAYDREQMKSIPFGQPILVGHHSEKKHRAAIKRAHQRSDRIGELLKKADFYRQKASIQNRLISSDDPEAISKLNVKLMGLETWQLEMKRINQAYGSKGGVIIEELPEKIKQLALHYLKLHDKPFPAFALSNNRTNIRRIKQRIGLLQKQLDCLAREPIRGKGYTLSENKEINRIEFNFDEKPSRDICRMMRSYGFCWSPRRRVWMRQLTPIGWTNAQMLSEKLEALRNASREE